MSRGSRNVWTEAMLAECRQLFEDGINVTLIGNRYGVTGSTISVMAWQRKWVRKKQVELKTLKDLETVEAADEVELTERLRQSIESYWDGRVRLRVERLAPTILCIRSNMINGRPR